ncbi:ERBB receptor feedback inhibitor 1a [Gambusia affinis]|uniref:ERBB receptor feedback inhibitor 1a n=1 Tax=Gambusia affinis TaxID=33528 RepID=UPI000F3489C5|nr:ERBB receptor feedback inhibitor 1a [Gambusia affinis]
MRSDCAWSMSTVGLTAQEISLPIENPFLRGSYCHSMAGSKPIWSYRQEDIHNFYFTMDSHRESSHRTQQKVLPQNHEKLKYSPKSQRLAQKKSLPSHLSLTHAMEPATPSPADDMQRLSVNENSPPVTPVRCSKPLPPIPPQTDISTEQAMDDEVEFFTGSDESRRLVSTDDQSSKSSPFRRGLSHRRSLRNDGKINPAYYDGPLRPHTQHQSQPQHQHQHHNHHACHQQEVRQQHEQQRQEPPEHAACPRPQDKAQRKLRRSHSGPAGKPSFMRLCPKRYTNGSDKPEVPPPIPPRMVKTTESFRWSAEVSSGAYSDDDKPPKLPPRDHFPRSISRTPSPKSLPTYENGVMPPTQSFAPDPKYCRSFHRQYSEGSTCTVPIIVKGDSNTHYYIVSQGAPFADSSCECHTKRKVDLV